MSDTRTVHACKCFKKPLPSCLVQEDVASKAALPLCCWPEVDTIQDHYLLHLHCHDSRLRTAPEPAAVTARPPTVAANLLVPPKCLAWPFSTNLLRPSNTPIASTARPTPKHPRRLRRPLDQAHDHHGDQESPLGSSLGSNECRRTSLLVTRRPPTNGYVYPSAVTTESR